MARDAELAAMRISPFEMTEARRRNQEMNIAEHKARVTTLKSLPLVLFIELTQNCNLRCPMCRYGSKYTTDWNMSEAIFDRLAEELFPYAHIIDLRGWGESTMLPNFDRFVARVLAHRLHLRLVTNGQINKRAVWDAMMAAHGSVVISCDAADPDLFKKLRAGGTIARLSNTTRTLVDARNRHGAPRDSIRFITTVSRDNLHDLVNIVELAARLEVSTVMLHPLVTHLSDPSHLRHDLAGTAEAYNAVADKGREEGVVVHLDAAPDPALALPEMVRRAPCIHPWSYAYIRHNGKVGFCDHMLGDDRYSLGSLTEKPFGEIWNGEQWVDVRRSHISGDIPDRFAPCRWTYAQRYIDFEEMVYPERRKGIVSTETHGNLLFARDPAAVPPVPWGPEFADDPTGDPDDPAFVPLEYLATRLQRMEAE